MAETTKAGARVKVEGIDGYWRAMSGGGGSSDYSRDYNGGDRTPVLLAGPPSWDDLEIERRVDPIRDYVWIKKLRPLLGLWHTTVTLQWVDVNGAPVGPVNTYAAALLVGMQEPEMDGNSSDPATVTLTLAHNGPK